MRARLNILLLSVFIVLSGASSAQEAEGIDLPVLDSIASRSEFEAAFEDFAHSQLFPNAKLPESIESLWNWSQNHGDSSDIVRVMLERGRYFNALGVKGKAIATLSEVRDSPYADEKLKFRATMFLRDYYLDLDAFDKAFELHGELNWGYAPDFYQRYAPECFLGSLYFKIGNYEKAVDAYGSAMQKMEQANKPYWQLSFTNSRGVVFERLGMLDSALAQYLKARYLLESEVKNNYEASDDRLAYIHGLLVGNQGHVLALLGNYDEAIPLLREDINSSLKYQYSEEGRQNAFTSLIQLSSCYLAIQDLVSSRTCIDRAKGLILKNDPPELWDAYYEAEANHYELAKDELEAAKALRLLVALRDSVQSHQRIIKTQNMVIAHESIIKDREKEMQQRQIELLQRKEGLQRQTNAIFIAVIILSLLITAAAIFRFNAKSRQQIAIQAKNKEIELQKQMIETSLLEKETLLREVNHRVKNNLQIVSSLLFLQSRNTDDPKLKEMIKEAHQRVQTMSIIHQKLYQESQFDHVEFDTYLTELISQTVSSYRLTDVKVETNIDIQYLDVSIDQAIPLSLIIHELVTNSMKHAFQGLKEGMIAVQLTRVNGELSLRYEDDGSGLKSEDLEHEQKSIGMKVIELLTQQIKGTITIIEHRPLILRIDFPVD